MTSLPQLTEWTGAPVRVGVIGGSGLYKLDKIEPVAELNIATVRSRLPA